MMAPRLCYAMDVPRGALLVHHAVVVADVRVLPSHGSVHFTGADGQHYKYAMGDQLLIDEDTPERRERLARARALLSGGAR